MYGYALVSEPDQTNFLDLLAHEPDFCLEVDAMASRKYNADATRASLLLPLVIYKSLSVVILIVLGCVLLREGFAAGALDFDDLLWLERRQMPVGNTWDGGGSGGGSFMQGVAPLVFSRGEEVSRAQGAGEQEWAESVEFRTGVAADSDSFVEKASDPSPTGSGTSFNSSARFLLASEETIQPLLPLLPPEFDGAPVPPDDSESGGTSSSLLTLTLEREFSAGNVAELAVAATQIGCSAQCAGTLAFLVGGYGVQVIKSGGTFHCTSSGGEIGGVAVGGDCNVYYITKMGDIRRCERGGDSGGAPPPPSGGEPPAPKQDAGPGTAPNAGTSTTAPTSFLTLGPYGNSPVDGSDLAKSSLHGAEPGLHSTVLRGPATHDTGSGYDPDITGKADRGGSKFVETWSRGKSRRFTGGLFTAPDNALLASRGNRELVKFVPRSAAPGTSGSSTTTQFRPTSSSYSVMGSESAWGGNFWQRMFLTFSISRYGEGVLKRLMAVRFFANNVENGLTLVGDASMAFLVKNNGVLGTASTPRKHNVVSVCPLNGAELLVLDGEGKLRTLNWTALEGAFF